MPRDAANDNGACRDATGSPTRRDADRLEAQVRRLQAAAARASLDALAHILTLAVEEAHRVADWEGRIEAELADRPGSRRPVDH